MTKKEQKSEEQSTEIKFIPTVDYYNKMYGRNMEGNDQKACSVFRSFESKEKLRRLQSELQWIKNGRVSEPVCDQVIGKSRKAKYQGYVHWSELMLIWLVSKQK